MKIHALKKLVKSDHCSMRKGANVAHAACEPLQRFKRVHRGKEIGEIFTLADINATLDPLEAKALQYIADVLIGLLDTLGMTFARILDQEIKGYRKHYGARGSDMASARG